MNERYCENSETARNVYQNLVVSVLHLISNQKTKTLLRVSDRPREQEWYSDLLKFRVNIIESNC